MDINNFCVIMAGGAGTRFWPLSKSSRPKQFLDVLGSGKTLIQQTFERFLGVCPVENFYVVTNARYKDLVLEQLPLLTPEQVLLEPIRRNTAPCIAYASYKIMRRNANAKIIVTPSDHLILKEQIFHRVIEAGLNFVSRENVLLTLGIKPSRPETGYGYIQINGKKKVEIENIFPVKTFTEKPHAELANIFFESGEFYWNSGIFLWSLPSIIEAFQEYLPEVHNLFNGISPELNGNTEQEVIDRIYPECQNISIDYGILEKADNVYVLCADFGWSDLGTWGSLFENSSKDDNKNVVQGGKVMLYESKNCIVNVPDNKLVVIQGLKDYIVVESQNTLLVCKKSNEQEIRKFVKDVKMTKGDEFV